MGASERTAGGVTCHAGADGQADLGRSNPSVNRMSQAGGWLLWRKCPGLRAVNTLLAMRFSQAGVPRHENLSRYFAALHHIARDKRIAGNRGRWGLETSQC